MKSKRAVLKPAKIEGFEIPMYRFGDGRTAFVDIYGGPRKWRAFTSEEKAYSEARSIARRVLRGETVRHELKQSDVDAYRRILQLTQPFDIAPTVALEEWVAAKKLCKDRSLLDVVKCGTDNLDRPTKTCHEAMEALLDAKRLAGLSSIYLAELTEDLTFFGRTFGNRPIASITTEDVQDWLVAHPVGPRRRNNLRATLVTLFRFAQNRKWLPPGRTAPQEFQKAKEKRGVVTTYTPAEMKFWIDHVREEYLPWLVIGGFSGVRTEEICPPPESHKDRLRWDDFKWAKRLIDVRAEVSKTNERRLVPIMDNLYEWLTPWHNAKGPVIPLGKRTDRESGRLSKFSQRWTARAERDPLSTPHPCHGLHWKQNALRHSYGSYRMAITKNAPQVSYEMGNSVSMIKRHYHEAKEEDQAVQYFGITPPDGQANIVQLNLGGL